MSPEALQRLSRLLDGALDCEPDRRESWLAGLEGDDAVLVPRLRGLLALNDGSTSIERLDAGPAFGAATSTPGPDAPKLGLAAGQRIGPYRLLRELGVGGMGEVWLAERADGLLKRQVALKLPMLGLRREVLVQRFARERDILATLEHPHIARLYDAGLSEDGQPYLALEYVEGTPIDAWCRDQAATVEQRMRLLLQVADAVAYAHRRLVLHRDLKPSNILVNAAAEVRLLDFGVAKLMESSGSAESTELTEAFGRALTLRYASPEQLGGEALTTASDVFSLGVVAFELLAGEPPFAVHRASPAALALRLAAEEAPRASTRAADPALRQRLRGDLDAILGRALKRRPEERYPTVEALAEDLQRHLAGERVAARPDSLGYRARRLALRYRWPLGAAGDAAAALASAEKALRLIESWADASLSPDRVQALGQIALAHLAMSAMGEARRCVDEANEVRARHHTLGHHITRALDEASEALRAAGT
ncbi:MAG: serine/threonine-protein kinase [Burkholderiales bacterium]